MIVLSEQTDGEKGKYLYMIGKDISPPRLFPTHSSYVPKYSCPWDVISNRERHPSRLSATLPTSPLISTSTSNPSPPLLQEFLIRPLVPVSLRRNLQSPVSSTPAHDSNISPDFYEHL